MGKIGSIWGGNPVISPVRAGAPFILWLAGALGAWGAKKWLPLLGRLGAKFPKPFSRCWIHTHAVWLFRRQSTVEKRPAQLWDCWIQEYIQTSINRPTQKKNSKFCWKNLMARATDCHQLPPWSSGSIQIGHRYCWRQGILAKMQSTCWALSSVVLAWISSLRAGATAYAHWRCQRERQHAICTRWVRCVRI